MEHKRLASNHRQAGEIKKSEKSNYTFVRAKAFFGFKTIANQLAP
jgi:hypothetical protein